MDTHHWAWGTECVCAPGVFSWVQLNLSWLWEASGLFNKLWAAVWRLSAGLTPRWRNYTCCKDEEEKKKKKDCNETVSWNTSFNPDLQFKESDLRCLRCEGLTPEVTHLHGKLLSINWWGEKKGRKINHPSIHWLSVTSYPFQGHGWSRVQLTLGERWVTTWISRQIKINQSYSSISQ